MNAAQAGERARALVRSHRSGVLSTASLQLPGYPFGAATPHATDAQGRPLLLLSHLAEHRQNLEADPRASYLVSTPGPHLHQHPRACLVGRIKQTTEADAARRYFGLFPSHQRYLEIGGFDFFRLEPERIRLIAGFGSQHWEDGADYLAPLSDLAEGEASVLAHMNADHAEALPDLLRHHHSVATESAHLVGFDCDGLDLAGGETLYRIAFSARLESMAGARALLARLAREARAP